MALKNSKINYQRNIVENEIQSISNHSKNFLLISPTDLIHLRPIQFQLNGIDPLLIGVEDQTGRHGVFHGDSYVKINKINY